MMKAFDAVQWMRQRRAQIDDEDHGLNWEEKRLRTRQIVMQDPLLAPLGGKAVSPESLHPFTTKER